MVTGYLTSHLLHPDGTRTRVPRLGTAHDAHGRLVAGRMGRCSAWSRSARGRRSSGSGGTGSSERTRVAAYDVNRPSLVLGSD